jgi:hypothetical protein
MSRSAKKMKLEPSARTNGHLHSGQFMTSRIDDKFKFFCLLNILAN